MNQSFMINPNIKPKKDKRLNNLKYKLKTNIKTNPKFIILNKRQPKVKDKIHKIPKLSINSPTKI